MNLTDLQLEAYRRDGFLVFPELFSADEARLLKREAERVARIDSECVVREGSDGKVKIMFRLHEPDSPTASPAYRAAAHCPRVLATAQRLLGDDEVYLHHLKVNMKAAIEGSAWPWHQDFGSWHLDGIARPDMLTVMVMLDEATEMNGCLYFLPGSHRDGRTNPYFDTSTAYKLWAVQPDDVKAYMDAGVEPVPITGPPGTVAVFDCNVLHASGHNLSARNRWQAYFCFNRVANRPQDVESPRPHYVRSTNWAPMPLGADADVLAAT
ncbi:MAG: phytanoyl-CoA dioxygenase family protein [Gammaproteobacteria bacterium]|nr:phytanoyl-CoA dioxygenase family protein [Gammaproteobacteria bacterium]